MTPFSFCFILLQCECDVNLVLFHAVLSLPLRSGPGKRKKQEDLHQNLLLFFVSYIIAVNDNSILF